MAPPSGLAIGCLNDGPVGRRRRLRPQVLLKLRGHDLRRRVRADRWQSSIVPDATTIHESGGSQGRRGTRTRVKRSVLRAKPSLPQALRAPDDVADREARLSS